MPRHRALGYWIEPNKLWRLGDGKATRARPRQECVFQKGVVKLARTEHLSKEHWHHDLIKKQLMDKFCSPRLGSWSVVNAKVLERHTYTHCFS